MTYNGKVPRYRTLLYETAAGVAVVANKLGSIAKSSHQSFTAIQTGIEMLEQYGPDPGPEPFQAPSPRRGRASLGASSEWETGIPGPFHACAGYRRIRSVARGDEGGHGERLRKVHHPGAGTLRALAFGPPRDWRGKR